MKTKNTSTLCDFFELRFGNCATLCQWRVAWAVVALVLSPSSLSYGGMFEEPPVEVDSSPLEVHTSPREFERGYPDDIGYVGRGAIERISRYRTKDRVVVDTSIVTHPKDYPYGVHDLFGWLDRSPNISEFRRKRESPGAAPVREPFPKRFVEWKDESGVSRGIVCSIQAKTDETVSGTVSWYGTVDGKLKTVSIDYTGLKGIPQKIVDSLLREVPSELRKDDPAQVDWETKDLRKWADLLRKPDPDGAVREIGSEYLKRYDKESFGLLLLVWGKHNDPTADWAVETARIADRIEAELREDVPAAKSGK